MPAWAKRAGVWVPPLALMALIFALSGMPSDDPDRGLLHLVGRKVAHFSEYALLCALWWRALRMRIGDRSAITWAVVVSVAYACSDEWHQTFVDGRVGAPADVAIDSAGALAASVLISSRSRRPSRA